MKRGTTTPLPPYCPTGVGLEPEYDDVIDIIEDIWGIIEGLEKRTRDLEDHGLERKLDYYYDLSIYWENIYLLVTRQKFYDDIF